MSGQDATAAVQEATTRGEEGPWLQTIGDLIESELDFNLRQIDIKSGGGGGLTKGVSQL